MTDFDKYGIQQGPGKEHEEILYSLALLYNHCTLRINNLLRPHHLTTGKLNILVAIRHHGGPKGISQVEISKHLIVTPSNMTKLLDKLEKDNLVTRSAQPGDRRVNIIKTTKKAETLLDKIWPDYCQLLAKLTTALPLTKQRQLATQLKDWLTALV